MLDRIHYVIFLYIIVSLFISDRMSVSFAGCGFIGVYHIGAASCLQTYAPFLLNGLLAGTSAGSMAAAAIVGGVSLTDMAREVLSVVCKANEQERTANIYKIIIDLSYSLKLALKLGIVY
jgi:predicted acylesterase/phospholipase RssA